MNHFETPRAVFTLLDAPGHRDFVPNTITGITQADVAVLVVDATAGEFEMGLTGGGQTREHAHLIRSAGVSQLVVAVNKMDGHTVGWDGARFAAIVGTLAPFLIAAGFKPDSVAFVPVSGLTGLNLVKRPVEQFLGSLGGSREELEALLAQARGSSSVAQRGSGSASTPAKRTAPASSSSSSSSSSTPALASDSIDRRRGGDVSRRGGDVSGGADSAEATAAAAAIAAREARDARQMLADMGLDDMCGGGGGGVGRGGEGASSSSTSGAPSTPLSRLVSGATTASSASSSSSTPSRQLSVPDAGVTAEAVRSLLSWYGEGPTLLEALEAVKLPGRSLPPPPPPRTPTSANSSSNGSGAAVAVAAVVAPPGGSVGAPLRFVVSDVYKHAQHGLCVAGRVEGGFLVTHSRLLVVPGE